MKAQESGWFHYNKTLQQLISLIKYTEGAVYSRVIDRLSPPSWKINVEETTLSPTTELK